MLSRESHVDQNSATDYYVEEGAEPWPLVSNPAARRVLWTISRLLPAAPHQPSFHRLRCAPPCVSPAGWEIRQRLERSGLAQAIAGGLDLLPEIYPHLPPALQPLYRLFTPRKPEQVAVHVLDNLGWYLSPGSAVRSGITSGCATVGLILLLFAGIPISLALSGPAYLPAILVTLAGLTLLGSRWWANRPQSPLDSHSATDLEASEFFCYLLNAYSDK